MYIMHAHKILQIAVLLNPVQILIAIEFARAPFGPRMCEELCRHIGHCSSYTFSDSELTCYPKTGTIGRSDVARTFTLNYQETDKSSRLCPKNSKVVLSRRKKIQCVRGKKLTLPQHVFVTGANDGAGYADFFTPGDINTCP